MKLLAITYWKKLPLSTSLVSLPDFWSMERLGMGEGGRVGRRWIGEKVDELCLRKLMRMTYDLLGPWIKLSLPITRRTNTSIFCIVWSSRTTSRISVRRRKDFSKITDAFQHTFLDEDDANTLEWCSATWSWFDYR